MDVTEFDKKIAQHETELKALRAAADGKVEALLKILLAEMATWMPISARAHIAEHSDLAEKALQDGKLAAIKADVNAAIAGLEGAFMARMTKDALWPHRDGYKDDGTRSPPDPGSVYEVYSGAYQDQRIPAVLYKELQSVVQSTVGAAFKAHGFLVKGYRGEIEYDKRFDPKPAVWGPPLSAYSVSNKAVQKALTEFQAAKKEKARAVAIDAWDKL